MSSVISQIKLLVAVSDPMQNDLNYYHSPPFSSDALLLTSHFSTTSHLSKSMPPYPLIWNIFHQYYAQISSKKNKTISQILKIQSQFYYPYRSKMEYIT